MSLERLIDTDSYTLEPEKLYTEIVFPDAPPDRPYLFINMASTADGKIVLGDARGSAAGLGGATDQLLFRRLQLVCDAAIMGSGTLRSTQVIYPPEIMRIVVTRSGNVPLDNRFFKDAPEKAYVLVPRNLPEIELQQLLSETQVIQTGEAEVDLAEAMQILRQDFGIEHILCEGGATLNENVIRLGLADELFLTIAPKLKGGTGIPTIVGGIGFPPGFALPLTIISLYRDGDEVYFRYRIGEKALSYK